VSGAGWQPRAKAAGQGDDAETEARSRSDDVLSKVLSIFWKNHERKIDVRMRAPFESLTNASLSCRPRRGTAWARLAKMLGTPFGIFGSVVDEN